MNGEFGTSTRRESPGAVVVAVRGEIDLFTTPEFKEAVNDAIARQAETVVVDLTEATFMDSSSLGVLIGANRRLGRRGGSIVVACDREEILKVLRITGLDGVFTVVPTVDQAIAARAA